MMIRGLRDDQIGEFTALFNRAEFDDPEFRRLDEEKMRKRIFSGPNSTLDHYFAVYDDGEMVAAGSGKFNPEPSEERASRAWMEIHILPGHLDSDAGRELFSTILEYLDDHGVKKIRTRTYLSNVGKVRFLKSVGFHETPYQRYAMRRDPRGVTIPELPDGYRMRNPVIPNELKAITATANQAYATRGGFQGFTLEQISSHAYFTDPASHSGNFIIERTADGRVVGAFCSYIDRASNELKGRSRGGSYLLVVIPEERKRGFGKALTAASLNWLASQGMTEAFLGVNHQNPDALKVYTDMGYERFDGLQGFEIEV